MISIHNCRNILSSLHILETGEPGLAGAISRYSEMTRFMMGATCAPSGRLARTPGIGAPHPETTWTVGARRMSSSITSLGCVT